jgi:hypothetical protein
LPIHHGIPVAGSSQAEAPPGKDQVGSGSGPWGRDDRGIRAWPR